MKHELDAEEYQEKAALYALGALSQHEARSFERHLAEGCPTCEAGLTQFEEVTGMLSLDSPPASPPAHLRGALMARIEKETTRGLNRPIRLRESGAAESAERRMSSAEQSSRSRSSFGTVIIPWAAAASLAIVVGALLFAQSRTGRDVENLRAQLDEMNRNQQRVAQDLIHERSREEELLRVNEVLLSPEHRQIALAGQAPAPTSSGKVYWDLQKNRWVVTSDLPPPPKGKVYQLWFVTNKNETISAGLILTDETGHGFWVTNVPSNIAPIAAAAITLEPEGGSTTPTMPIYTMGAAG